MDLLDLKWNLLFSRIYYKVVYGDLLDRAAQVAFYFTFSIFPLLYFLITLFGIVLESADRLKNELFGYLYQLMPESAYTLVTQTVEEIVTGSTTGRLTLGLAVTLWSASIGLDGLRIALNSIYGLRETRPYWRTKLESLSLTFLLILLLATAVAIVFFGWQLVQFGVASLGITVTSPLILVLVQWVAMIAVMLLACEIVYNLLPNYERLRWIWVTPGSVVAIFVWILLTGGFRLYLQYFNTYNRTYGSLGAVMILMLWLYLTAAVLLIGAAINSAWKEVTASKEDDETDR
jgi:membrane protein